MADRLIDLPGAETALKVIDLLADEDNFYLTLDEHIFIRSGPEKWHIYANCNDIFWWATADAEEITEDNLPVLKQCMKDIYDIGETISDIGRLEGYPTILFAARIRGMRPQGAVYRNMMPELVTLFDECGPPREADNLPFGNPVAR